AATVRERPLVSVSTPVVANGCCQRSLTVAARQRQRPGTLPPPPRHWKLPHSALTLETLFQNMHPRARPIYLKVTNAVDQPVESSRLEKLRNIEALGVDPWGQRFDGHHPIQKILELPADLPEGERPAVKAAGRIVSRRIQGKVHWLDLRDWSGHLT